MRALYWTPRVLGILFIVFISLFALDIFGQGYNFWQTVVGLFMHLIPSFVLILVLLVAWKKEILGGWLYLALSLVFIAIVRGNVIYSLPTLVLPIILTGVLFLASGRRRKKSITEV